MEYVYMIGSRCDDLYWGNKETNSDNEDIIIFSIKHLAEKYIKKLAKEQDCDIKDLCEFIVPVKLQEEPKIKIISV